MTTLSWNCRGLAATSTGLELKGLIKQQQPAIIFLMETRAPEERVVRLKRRVKYTNHFVVNPNGLAGGLCLLWNKKVEVEIKSANQNFIHTEVSFKEGGKGYLCTFVYGNPRYQERRHLWGRLLRLRLHLSTPWCCVGDFNELLSQWEKDGRRPQQ